MKIENIFRTNPSPFTVNTDFKSDVELEPNFQITFLLPTTRLHLGQL